MEHFPVIHYIKKWKYLIIVFMVLGGFIFYLFFSRRQVYTAYTMITYTNEGAVNGKTPSGADLDVSKIYASNVVSRAIESLGMDPDLDVDFVRSGITVEPIIDEEEQTRKEALLSEGEVYEEKPTEYYISFSVGSEYSEDFAKNVLNEVINSYLTYYGERYVAQSITPNNIENLSGGQFDYIDKVDIIKQSIEDILSYLKVNDESFRSSKTGYSFYDLSSLYNFIRDVSVDRLYVDILSGKLTKDRDVLVEKYRADIQSLKLQMEREEEQSDGLLDLLEQYNPKILTAQEYSAAFRGESASDSIILQDIYERSDDMGNPVYSENTYDTLMNQYVSYNRMRYELEKKIEEKEYILSMFSDETEADPSVSREELDRNIDSLISRLNELYELFFRTGQEYNDYLVGKNVEINSSVKAQEKLNLKIYLAVTLFLFLGGGCVGAVILGRLGEIIERTLYIDKKTRLPNRLSCDEYIKTMNQRGMVELCTCVNLRIMNLKEINVRQGREAGDKILRDLGRILDGLSKEYGFIGYNGGNSILCILDNCSYDKAVFMLEVLKDYIKQDMEESSVKITAQLAESGRMGIYKIYELISCTYEQEERTIW